MIQKFFISLLLSCYLVVTGCAILLSPPVVGVGVGVGVYTYIKGELRRSYHATFDETVRASTDTLERLKIVVTEKTSDGITATIRARHADRTPVTVKVAMITPGVTEVSIRSGIIGIWDRGLSELIHGNIAQRLSK